MASYIGFGNSLIKGYGTRLQHNSIPPLGTSPLIGYPGNVQLTGGVKTTLYPVDVLTPFTSTVRNNINTVGAPIMATFKGDRMVLVEPGVVPGEGGGMKVPRRTPLEISWTNHK